MNGMSSAGAFYLPPDERYSILDSAIDAARYAVAATVPSLVGGNALSFLVDIDGAAVRTGPNKRLMQGVGYCADAPFGAGTLFALSRHTGRTAFAETAKQVAIHSLYAGYLDDPEIPVRLYRDAESGEFFDQLEANCNFLDLGHMAKVVLSMVELSPYVGEPERIRIADLSARFAAFAMRSARTPSGWLPRRLAHDLSAYPYARNPPDSPVTQRIDPLADRSGAGLFTVTCLLRLAQLGLVDTRSFVAEACEAFVSAGGYFGSVNTDTEDNEESVSFALAFQTLLDAAKFLDIPRYKEFAFEACLPPLKNFWLTQDINGQPTKGLLRLSKTYSAACMWECSEAAMAYFKAAKEAGDPSNVANGLTILRAIARNHHGDLGFIPSELDWNGSRSPDAHLGQATYGPRKVTHPYMNNLHVVRSTLFYLDQLPLAHLSPGRSVGRS